MAKRFIKLAVDDTATTALWGWEAEGFFPRLLRLCYPSGEIDCGRKPVPFVLSRWTRWPEEIIEAALEDMVGSGTVTVVGGTVAVPKMRTYHFGQGRPPGATAAKSGVPPNTSEPINGNKSFSEKSSHSLSSSPSAVPTAQSTADPDYARAWAEVAVVTEQLACSVTPPKGLRAIRIFPQKVFDLIRTGITAEEIVQVVRGLAAAIDTGKEPRKHWNPHYVFNGWYDTLRTQYLGGAEAVTAEGESPVERLARLEREASGG